MRTEMFVSHVNGYDIVYDRLAEVFVVVTRDVLPRGAEVAYKSSREDAEAFARNCRGTENPKTRKESL